MTPKQKAEHNKMRSALKQIQNQFDSLVKLRVKADETYGLTYVKALETQILSLKKAAAEGVKGIRVAK